MVMSEIDFLLTLSPAVVFNSQDVKSAHLFLLQMFDEDSWLPYSRQGSQRHRASFHLKNEEEISKLQFRCSKHTKLENGSNIKVVIGNIDSFIFLVCTNLFFAAHPSIPPGHNQSYLQSYVMMFYIHFLYIVHKH